MSAVYLGNTGYVELERVSNNLPILSRLDPEDVNVALRRWSVDNDRDALITGDRLAIETTDGSNLQLVAGHDFPDGLWYAHIDAVGGIYLYNTYEEALNGDFDSALELVAPDAEVSQEIRISLGRERFRCVAQMTQWQLTTSREAVDLTSLGEEYRYNYTNGLISGQGDLSCFWEFESCRCDAPELITYPHYLSQLVIRTKLGGAFKGRFFIHSVPLEEYIWYEALCIVTNVAIAFAPGDPVTSQIQFVTSGPVVLRHGMPPSYMRLQQGTGIVLQQDQSRLQITL